MTAINRRFKCLFIDDVGDELMPSLELHVGRHGFDFAVEEHAKDALHSIAKIQPNVILLDLKFPGDDRRKDGNTTGAELFAQIHALHPDLPVVVCSSRLDETHLPIGNFRDYLPDGWFAKSEFALPAAHWAPRLAGFLDRAIVAAEKRAAASNADLGFVVGKSHAMRQVAGQVLAAAGCTDTVVIYGEIGTRKSVVAQAIHNLGERRDAPFVVIDCAKTQVPRKKFFEGAHGGTVLLDKFQSAGERFQKILIGALEAGSERPGGAADKPSANFRLIVATSIPLGELLRLKRLREGLFYRLHQIMISLPPLRDRVHDLDLLCEEIRVRQKGSTVSSLHPTALQHLANHYWPGNIRELELILSRSMQENTNVLLPFHIHIERAVPHSTAISTEQSALGITAEQQAQAPTVVISLTRDQRVQDLTRGLFKLKEGERHERLLEISEFDQKDVFIEFAMQLSKGKKLTGGILGDALDPEGKGDKRSNRLATLMSDKYKVTLKMLNDERRRRGALRG